MHLRTSIEDAGLLGPASYSLTWTQIASYYTVALPVHFLWFIKSRHMREGYSSHFVCLCICLCVCVSITALAATYLVYYVQSETVYSFLSAFKDLYCVDFTENVSFGRYGVHDDWQLSSFSTKNTPVVLDTITNGIAYEPLARARTDDYLN